MLDGIDAGLRCCNDALGAVRVRRDLHAVAMGRGEEAHHLRIAPARDVSGAREDDLVALQIPPGAEQGVDVIREGRPGLGRLPAEDGPQDSVGSAGQSAEAAEARQQPAPPPAQVMAL